MKKGKSQMNTTAQAQVVGGGKREPKSPKGKHRQSKVVAPVAGSVRGSKTVLQPEPVVGVVETSQEKDSLKSTFRAPPAEVKEGDPPPVKLKMSLDEGFQQMRASYMRYQNSSSNMDKTGKGGGRIIIRNLWDICCSEVESEVNDLDLILKKLGLPSVNFSKTKMYDITEYDSAPDLVTCKVKDFLDFYVFPYLLPAIQALVQFARVNRVFQCRFCTFNALDFIVEYLHNNNPRYPERLTNPIPLFEIPFCKEWLEKYPRKPPPKWMLMNSEEAAVIIQRAVRGYMVRCRPDVQEMRKFWRDIRRDMEEERMLLAFGRMAAESPPTAYYEEFYGESEETVPTVPSFIPMHHDDIPSPGVSHHSDNCVYCDAFRKFIDSQPEELIKSYARRPSTEPSNSPGGSPPNNDQKTGSGANLSTGKGAAEGGETVAAENGGDAQVDENQTLPASNDKEKGKRKESAHEHSAKDNVPVTNSNNVKGPKPAKAGGNTQAQIASPVRAPKPTIKARAKKQEG